MARTQPVALRWTIGNVSDRGFEALQLSIWGAWNIFGPQAAYAVCVNTIPIGLARKRTGPLPGDVAWHDASGDLPEFIRAWFGPGMAEGVGWKFAPLQLFPERHEISLDNDCILWAPPPSIQAWLASETECLLAEDVRACFGQFADVCPPEPRNSGIRGLPPGFDLEAALRAAMEARRRGGPPALTSELDEQGLQTAALSLTGPLRVTSLREVSICSPFPPHMPGLGECGAHFVGLNTRHIAWDVHGRPADDWMTGHWNRHRPQLYRRTGAPQPTAV
jgi:hypothetical protein